MNESSSLGYQDEQQMESAPGPPGAGVTSPAQHRFTADEMRVLKECNKESFFQRSLPLGITMGLGTYYAIQRGHLKPNPRLGVIPKVTLAVMLGYFVGKLSYQQTCAEKLMNLPGSYIGQLLRERRDGVISGGHSSVHKPPPTMFGANPNDIYSDAGPGNSLDLDTNRPMFNDDSYHPGHDDNKQHIDSASPRPALSYDDLRKQNRGQHTESKQEPYKMDQLPPLSRRPPPPPPSQSTNKYGDVME